MWLLIQQIISRNFSCQSCKDTLDQIESLEFSLLSFIISESHRSVSLLTSFKLSQITCIYGLTFWWQVTLAMSLWECRYPIAVKTCYKLNPTEFMQQYLVGKKASHSYAMSTVIHSSHYVYKVCICQGMPIKCLHSVCCLSSHISHKLKYVIYFVTCFNQNRAKAQRLIGGSVKNFDFYSL